MRQQHKKMRRGFQLAALALPMGNPVRIPVPIFVPRGLGQTSSAIQTIAAAIQTQEGYYPGSIAYTNNNPGNLIYAGQPGATKGANGFAVFDSYQDGLNALYSQIQSYANRGMTIQDMMNVYAPASVPGNNPTLYASNIANSLGTTPDASLSDVIAGSVSALPSWLTDLGSQISTDLSMFSLPDLSSIDPTTLVIGGVVALVVLVLVMRR